MGKLLDKFNKTKDDGKKVVSGNSVSSFQAMANIMAEDGLLDRLETSVGIGDKLTNEHIEMTTKALVSRDNRTYFAATLISLFNVEPPTESDLNNNYKLQRLIDTLSSANLTSLRDLNNPDKEALNDFTQFLSSNFTNDKFSNSMRSAQKNLGQGVRIDRIKQNSDICNVLETGNTILTNLQVGEYTSLNNSVSKAITATNDVSVVDPTTEVTAPTTKVTAQQVGTEPTSVQATSVDVADTPPVHAQPDVQSRSSVMREPSMDDTVEALNNKFISPVPVAKAESPAKPESPMPQLATNKTYFSMFMNAINTLVQGIANRLPVFSNASKSLPAKTVSTSLDSTTKEVPPSKPPAVSSVDITNNGSLKKPSKTSFTTALVSEVNAHYQNASKHAELVKNQPSQPTTPDQNKKSLSK